MALFDAISFLGPAEPRRGAGQGDQPGQGRSPLLFVEINTGGEPQKAGVLPEDGRSISSRIAGMTYGLTVAGLMCLPPADEPPAPHFALTAKIARRNELNLLSMGMSADFPAAIAMGSTHVRVGTAIFGRGAIRIEYRFSFFATGVHTRRSQLPHPHSDAAGGGTAVRPCHVHEDRTASPRDPRPRVVIDLDDQVVVGHPPARAGRLVHWPSAGTAGCSGGRPGPRPRDGAVDPAHRQYASAGAGCDRAATTAAAAGSGRAASRAVALASLG